MKHSEEKTTVDTNPLKVLEHENLKTGDGLTTSFNTDETTIRFKATIKPPETNLNTLGEGIIRGDGFPTDQVPSGDKGNSAAYITLRTDETTKMQLYFRESNIDAGKIVASYRFIKNGEPSEWKQMAVDNEELLSLLAQKQDKLTAGTGITIQGNTISATGTTSTIEFYQHTGKTEYRAFKQVVTNGNDTFVTFTFNCDPQSGREHSISGDLKTQLEKFVGANMTVSNGAISIKNDGTSMKLINSAPSESVHQQGTFTFYDYSGGGTES